MLFTAMSYVSAATSKLFRREEGATLVEYGLLVALIAIAALTAITTVGSSITSLFTTVSNNL